MKRLTSVLPVLAVTALLAAALHAPNLGAGARPVAVPDYLYYPTCSWVMEGGLGEESPYPIPDGEGVCQPIGAPQNLATCIFPLSTSNSAGRFDLVYWDPVALAPHPTAIALRSISWQSTYSAFGVSRFDMFPPVIVRSLHNVAEAPPSQLAMEYHIDDGGNPRSATLVQDDPTAMPAALRIAPDGTHTVLPGNHPVFYFQLCGGNSTLQNMRVVQCVSSTDATLDPLPWEYVQKFRVPVATTLRWVEFALDQYAQTRHVGVSRIRIADATGAATPPDTYPPLLMDAGFAPYYPGRNWDTHEDLTLPPTLQPDHDYWLIVTLERDYKLFAKTLSGEESPYFTTAIGGLFCRSVQGAPALPVPGRALCFRVVGTPQGTVDVEAVASAHRSFDLLVSPNPCRGPAVVSWSGARGDLRFEVLDARGRRVSSGAAGVGPEGRWTWSGTGDDGHSLPAGLYFVRARDGAGRASSARVTLVR